jgi:diguanylate cyclase (GGDEF)-like protein
MGNGRHDLDSKTHDPSYAPAGTDVVTPPPAMLETTPLHRKHCSTLLLLGAAIGALLAITSVAFEGRGWPFFAMAVASLALLGCLIGRALDRAEATAVLDSVTGLPGRRYIEWRISQEQARARRDHSTFVVLFIDIDNAANIWRRYGRRGERASLVAVATALRRACSDSDVAAYLGGDRFVVLCGGATAGATRGLAEGIKLLVPACNSLALIRLTVSIGVFEADGQQRVPPADVLEAAERDLAAARRQRRTTSERRTVPRPRRRPAELGVAEASL